MIVSEDAANLMLKVLDDIDISPERRRAELRFRVGIENDPVFQAIKVMATNRTGLSLCKHELIDEQLQLILATAGCAISDNTVELIAFPLKGQGAFIHHASGKTCVFVDEYLIALGLLLSRFFVPQLGFIDQVIDELSAELSASESETFFSHEYYNSVANDIASVSANEATYSVFEKVFGNFVSPYAAILEILSDPEVAHDRGHADQSFWRNLRMVSSGIDYQPELDIFYVRFFCAFLANIIGHEVGHLINGHLKHGRISDIRSLHALYLEKSRDIELEPLEEIDADFFAVDYIFELNRRLGWPQGDLVDVMATNAFSGLLFFLDSAGWWATKRRPLNDFEMWLCNALLWNDFPVLARFVESYPTSIERFSYTHIRMLEVHSSGVTNGLGRFRGSALYVLWSLVITSTIEEHPLGWPDFGGLSGLNPGRQLLLPESSLVIRQEAFRDAPTELRSSAADAFKEFDPLRAYSSRAFHDKFSSVSKYHARLQRDLESLRG